jgi:hypothetical protein
MTVGWLILGAFTLWLLWPHVRDQHPARTPSCRCDVPVTVLDNLDPWDDYVMGLKTGDVIVSPHDVEIELIDGWTADDVVSLLAELDRWPEIEAA